LGSTKYGTPVDIWSAGCILAELILSKPLFTGKTEMDQLQLIFELLGTPTSDTWEGFQDLKLLRTGEVTIETTRKAKLRDKYQAKMPGSALNLLEKLLELDPQKRLTAGRALDSRYFLADPRAPDRPEDLGPILLEGGHFHEFQTKKKRREAKIIAESAKQTALDAGRSEKQATNEYENVYNEIMEKVAKEGINSIVEDKKKEEKDPREKDEATKRDRKKDRASRPDRESRGERVDRKGGREERKEERKPREDREKDGRDDRKEERKPREDREKDGREDRKEERKPREDREKEKEHRSSRRRRESEEHHERSSSRRHERGSEDEKRKKRLRGSDDIKRENEAADEPGESKRHETSERMRGSFNDKITPPKDEQYVAEVKVEQARDDDAGENGFKERGRIEEENGDSTTDVHVKEERNEAGGSGRKSIGKDERRPSRRLSRRDRSKSRSAESSHRSRERSRDRKSTGERDHRSSREMRRKSGEDDPDRESRRHRIGEKERDRDRKRGRRDRDDVDWERRSRDRDRDRDPEWGGNVRGERYQEDEQRGRGDRGGGDFWPPRQRNDNSRNDQYAPGPRGPYGPQRGGDGPPPDLRGPPPPDTRGPPPSNWGAYGPASAEFRGPPHGPPHERRRDNPDGEQGRGRSPRRDRGRDRR
jgi:hypothetical protein